MLLAGTGILQSYLSDKLGPFFHFILKICRDNNASRWIDLLLFFSLTTDFLDRILILF